MNTPKSWKQKLGFLWILFTGGCSTFQFAPTAPAVYATNSYTPAMYEADLKLYEAASAGLADRTRLRDKIVYSTAKEIDKSYAEFKNTFFGERAATETVLDVAQIGLTSAGTFAGGQTPKLLAALATGVTGSRLSFNKNFFKEKTPDLLLSRMDALRTDQWAQIYLQLKNSTDDAYSFYEAGRDLVAYYEKGSLEAAFQNIIAESGAAQKEADADIKNQIRAKYGEALGPIAMKSELAEIEASYGEFRKLKGDAQEAHAKKIIEEFKKLEPKTPINPAHPNASAADGVRYLYSVAIQAQHAELRKDLVAAFNAAKQ